MGYNLEYTFEHLSDYTQTITFHKRLGSYLSQLELNNQELKDLHQKYVKNDDWERFSIYQVQQGWSNTSCGWETMGGSAISADYTIIIHNLYLRVIFVYYNGKLAYIAKDDEKLEKYKNDLYPYKYLPGMSKCTKQLNVIYKSKK